MSDQIKRDRIAFLKVRLKDHQDGTNRLDPLALLHTEDELATLTAPVKPIKEWQEQEGDQNNDSAK